jgi:hypothetical protein
MECQRNGPGKLPPKFNHRRGVFVLGKIDEILAWEQRKETEETRSSSNSRAIYPRPGGAVLEAGKSEVFR